MSGRGPNTSREFFEAMYTRDADPWDFASSEYERGRYRAILDALAGRRYARAFEPGCSIGVLTEGLAGLCDRVDAMDLSPRAIEHARERCQNLMNVHLICGSLLDALPDGEFDLMVLSEIGYYFEEETLRDIVQQLVGRLQGGGTLLAAHWLGHSPDHVLSGDRVHEVLGEVAGLSKLRSERHAGFRLEVWERA